MDVEKIRNTTEAELQHQQRELSDQLFRLKFQLKMGQTESLKKLRGLRKDIARIKTVMRERELGHTPNGAPAAAAKPAKAAAADAPAERKTRSAAAKSAKKPAHKKAARKTEKK
jgi:large subunit ribosomal protein L29